MYFDVGSWWQSAVKRILYLDARIQIYRTGVIPFIYNQSLHPSLGGLHQPYRLILSRLHLAFQALPFGLSLVTTKSYSFCTNHEFGIACAHFNLKYTFNVNNQ